MDLNSKQLVTSLISFHLSVVLWFVETGLLPENDGNYIITVDMGHDVIKPVFGVFEKARLKPVFSATQTI